MANTEKTYNNAWLNGVSQDLVREKTSASGHKFYSVSVDVGCDVTGTQSNWITLTVNPGQVMKSDKSQYLSILLGDMEKTRKVQAANKVKTIKGKAKAVKSAGYAELTLSNAAIAEAYDAQRKAYKAATEAAVVPAED